MKTIFKQWLKQRCIFAPNSASLFVINSVLNPCGFIAASLIMHRQSRVPLCKSYFCVKVKPRDLFLFIFLFTATDFFFFLFRFSGLRGLIAEKYWYQYEEGLKCILSRDFTGCKTHPHRALLNTSLPPTYKFSFMASSSILLHLFTPTWWEKWQHMVTLIPSWSNFLSL